MTHYIFIQLLYHWHFQKSRFAHALSLIPSGPNHVPSNHELWALYQLGMYQTIAQARTSSSLGWQGVFAKAVSLAACGQLSAAKKMAAEFRLYNCSRKHHVALANAILPFMPETAYSLLKVIRNVPLALLVTTQLRNDQVQEAQRLLNYLSPDDLRQQPELHLLRTNTCGGTPHEQMQRLNAFLMELGVPPLQLHNPSQPPSILNVMSTHNSKPVDGPLVTVLMTTFDTSQRAVAAINSVLAQTYHNLELIIVDDASGNETLSLVTKLAQGDTRIRLIALPCNVGTYIAKRIGLEQAKGEFVTCHDSDDWMHPERISRQVAPLLADPRQVCSTSNWIRIQDNGVFYARSAHPIMRLNPASPLFRRELVLRETGPWDCVRTGADSEFLARLHVVFGPKAIKKIRQPLTLGSHRPDSLMTAVNTGYSEIGISPHRQSYWEAWSHWHIKMLAKGAVPRIHPDIRTATQIRLFPASEQHPIYPESLDKCLAISIPPHP